MAIDDVQVYPDVDRKLARVRVRILNATGKPGRGALVALVAAARGSVAASGREKQRDFVGRKRRTGRDSNCRWAST